MVDIRSKVFAGQSSPKSVMTNNGLLIKYKSFCFYLLRRLRFAMFYLHILGQDNFKRKMFKKRNPKKF